ncbi:unnamed protein product [Linum tenue]|uniref:Uncharacterized protein n=1 Tax=Linum tenue TaxID=586396 RepID=A0AAV0PD49_9ROSI|nr:unnamed protein product [Linum tenue]
MTILANWVGPTWSAIRLQSSGSPFLWRLQGRKVGMNVLC